MPYDLMTYFNRHLKDYKYALINKHTFPAMYSRTGELYIHHPDLVTYEQAQSQYDISDLRESDTVLDLGANIGAFSLRCAKICKKVFAYEPITFTALFENIHLNKMEDKIIPMYGALGNGVVQPVNWFGVCRNIRTKTITQILEETGPVDFMKCDVEGAEWYIEPREVKDIRHIEMEFHMNDPLASQGKIDEYKYYFDLTKTDSKGKTLWYSMTNKYV
ncbi:MAG: FkbM family methyltransferase [Candidatus Bipolaricaulis sp.]|nr:FkbM family methyltransferase [Candidatus Bipolaricaulis sp.]